MCRTLSNNSDAIAERKEGEKKRGSFRKPNKIEKKEKKEQTGKHGDHSGQRTIQNKKKTGSKMQSRKEPSQSGTWGSFRTKTHMWVWYQPICFCTAKYRRGGHSVGDPSILESEQDDWGKRPINRLQEQRGLVIISISNKQNDNNILFPGTFSTLKQRKHYTISRNFFFLKQLTIIIEVKIKRKENQ